MLRRLRAPLIVFALSVMPTSCAAGTYTVTVADETQLKAVATKEGISNQQVVQRVVDAFLRGRQQEEINRKVAACRSGTDEKACNEIPALVKKLK